MLCCQTIVRLTLRTALFFVVPNINHAGHGAPGVHGECFSALSSVFTFFLTLLGCSSQTLVIERDQLMAVVLKWGTVLGRAKPRAALWGTGGCFCGRVLLK